MDVFLESKIICDKKLSSNAIAVYTALRMIQNLNTNKYYVNIKLLTFQLTNDITFSRKYMKAYDYGKKVYYCDHEDRTDDMGKLSVEKLPVVSPNWCPLRDRNK